jgi:hypothetical protein
MHLVISLVAKNFYSLPLFFIIFLAYGHKLWDILMYITGGTYSYLVRGWLHPQFSLVQFYLKILPIIRRSHWLAHDKYFWKGGTLPNIEA